MGSLAELFVGCCPVAAFERESNVAQRAVPHLWRAVLRRVRKRHRFKRLVLHRHQLAGALRLREILCDHNGHTIANMPDLVGRQDRLDRTKMRSSRRKLRISMAGKAPESIAHHIVASQNRQHAGRTARRGSIDCDNARVRMW